MKKIRYEYSNETPALIYYHDVAESAETDDTIKNLKKGTCAGGWYVEWYRKAN